MQTPSPTERAPMPPENAPAPVIALNKVTKTYTGTPALVDADFDLYAGEVHVLFGENGAGKSTLISLIAGVHVPTRGDILMDGKPLRFESVHDAREYGIGAVFQEFSLVPQMTVAENIFLGAEKTKRRFLDKKAMLAGVKEILQRLDFSLPPDKIVSTLTRAEQQMVEIAKAFRADPRVLILDEPTASLTNKETDKLFAMVTQLKKQGVAFIYITHRMAEIGRIGDRVTVLRDGNHIKTLDAKSASEAELVNLMTGRVISEVFPIIEAAPAEPVLSVRDLSTQSGRVKNVSFTAKAGEILGFAGLVGAGKSEVIRACFGLEKIAAGTVELSGDVIDKPTPRKMLDRGFFYLPPDRRDEGLMMMHSCADNIVLSALGDKAMHTFAGMRDARREKSTAMELAKKLNLLPLRPQRQVEFFSGGNQQKVVLAKSLVRKYKLFAFDEPTVGVDVGTRAAIYRFIKELCEAGAAVIIISSDLPEVLHLSHRLSVFYGGRLKNTLVGAEISEDAVLAHFFERSAA